MLMRELVERKENNLVSVKPDDDIRHAAATMIEQSVSALVVRSDEGYLAGILTERDVARFFAATEQGAGAAVSEAMTGDVITCTPDHDVSEIVEIMSDSNIRHVPVLANGDVQAVITIRDIVRYHLTALQSENQTLRELVAALD